MDYKQLQYESLPALFHRRQALYERFCDSDPLTRARVLNALYPKKEVVDCARFPPPLRSRTLSLRCFLFRIG